ncbi:MAG: lysophospholipid acyltransferase family protein [Rubripirellula sp.]
MADSQVPVVPTWFQSGFHAFLRPFLKRHFHAIAVDKESRDKLDIQEDEPLLVYGNHPSWWDPLIAHFLNQSLFPTRQFYAPIDAEALEQYQVFGKLGFYGVRLNTTSGAGAFLKQSMGILNAGQTAIWITPEGRFSDVRDHSAPLMPGLAHLCTRMKRGKVLPLALEYVFWEERLPVCLVKLGPCFDIAKHEMLHKSEWRDQLTESLRSTQSGLADLATARSSEPFEDLIRGKKGAGFFYDSFRRVKSTLGRSRFRANHGEQFE